MTETPIVLATLTFRRPAQLARLLPLLAQQAEEISPRPRILVVDNDPDQGAAAVVEGWSGSGVEYANEPRPGIAAARNRALELSSDAPAIVFIDDDETPTDGWLRTLVTAWKRERTAVVTGPALKIVPENIDPWIAASGFLQRWEFKTGTRVQGGSTNNILLDINFLHLHHIQFDEAFGLTGGSDAKLLQLVLHHGGEIMWCDEAQVLDPLPSTRLSRAWVLKRSFRTGNSVGRIRLDLASSPLKSRARIAIGGSLGTCRDSFHALLGRMTGDLTKRARHELRAASSAGFTASAFGYHYVEYSRGE